MPSFYRACDLACIPSRAEPFGRTVIEAFAAGVPVIATAVGGIAETVDDEETGLLVPYGNDQLLTDALERLTADDALRERIRTRARTVARKEYHERVYKQRILEVVENVALSTGKGTPSGACTPRHRVSS